jgi:hypothetical protein
MNENSDAKPAKAKMATVQGTPPGLEVDEHGRPIPFDQRTSGDREKVRGHIAAELHGADAKNPDGEAEAPAPAPKAVQGTAAKRDRDPEGRQGDTARNGQG